MAFVYYSLFRFFGWIISLLSYRSLHAFGRFAGLTTFYFYHTFRKKALSNLAIAYGKEKTEAERHAIAKKSFQSLMITCLEFCRLKRSKGKLSEIVTLEPNSEVLSLLEKKQGVVFLTGHQANWEIPFLAITDHFEGIAIGRPINNKWLYRWVLSVREMNGGKIVMPKSAIHQGMKALKQGKFLGIVGDQAFPESSYSYPLFGTRAWTLSTPALLAYKANCPLVVGTTERSGNKYIVAGSPAIWPDLTKPIKSEVIRMMDLAMGYLQKSIQKNPEQWMWVHDRWKQGGADHVKRKYRFGFILMILPSNPEFLSLPSLLRKIYPDSFLSFFVPEGSSVSIPDCDLLYYKEEKDLLVRDFRFQFVIDCTNSEKVRDHYHKLAALQILSIPGGQSKEKMESTLIQELVKPMGRF